MSVFLTKVVSAATTNRAKPPELKILVHRYCTLEPLQMKHVNTLLPKIGGRMNTAVWDHVPVGPIISAQELGELFEGYIRAPRSQCTMWVVLVDGAPLGYLGLLNADVANKTVDIGSVIFSPKLQRTTAASTAVYLVLKYAFELGYHRVQWTCDANNLRSANAAKRFGFIYEGALRNHKIVRKHIRKTKVFSMLPEEWEVQRRRFQSWLDPSNFDNRGRQIVPLRDCTASGGNN